MIRIQTKGKRLNDVDLSSALLPYLPYFLFHSSPNSDPTSDCDDVKHQQDSIVFGPPNPSVLFLLYKPLFHSEHVIDRGMEMTITLTMEMMILTCIRSLQLSRRRTPLPATFLVSTMVLRSASRLMCLLMSVASTMSITIFRNVCRCFLVRLTKISQSLFCRSLNATAKILFVFQRRFDLTEPARWWFSSTDSSLYIRASSEPGIVHYHYYCHYCQFYYYYSSI